LEEADLNSRIETLESGILTASTTESQMAESEAGDIEELQNEITDESSQIETLAS
jgi:hypothetical protein